jgi:1-deoxy-D-xylulose-5-phosphate synthase
MTNLMDKDDKVAPITAGMPDGTGLTDVIKQFPDRAFDVGIAESHAVDMAAGMAKAGMKPFVTVYSTFMQRAFDQVFQEVALQGLPVRICMDRAGLVGGDGAVHQGFLDVAFLRGFPNMVLMAAIDEPTLNGALEFQRQWEAGPSALRYPRDNVASTPHVADPPAFQLGKAHQLAEGKDLAVLAYGVVAYDALKVRQDLAAQGYNVAVYDARFAKPVDIELLTELIESDTPILTIEDHALTGGFGACVLEACHDRGLNTQRIHRLGLPDQWIYQGSRGEQLAIAGIDRDSIARKIRQVLDSTDNGEPQITIATDSADSVRSKI